MSIFYLRGVVWPTTLGSSHTVSQMSTERKALFISHATPESNAFTLWLGAKLTALGYEVFADILRLRRK